MARRYFSNLGLAVIVSLLLFIMACGVHWAWARITSTATAITGDGAITITSGGGGGITIDSASGTINTATGDVLSLLANITTNSNYLSTKSCSSFIRTRNGNLCLDPDGLTSQLFANATNGAINDTTVSHTAMDGAKFAIVKFYCDMLQDGTGESATTTLYATIL